MDVKTDQKQIAAHELDAFLDGVPGEFDGWFLQLRDGSVAALRSVRRRPLHSPNASRGLAWSVQFVDDAGARRTRTSEATRGPAWIIEVEDGTVRQEVYEHAFETLTFVRRPRSS